MSPLVVNEKAIVYKKEKKIYRYKFSTEFVFALMEFARMNIMLNSENFKKSWVCWSKINAEMIALEKQRLVDLGYNKSVEDKMYNSARYYFRSKYKNGYNDDMVKKGSKQNRRKYIPLNREFLKNIEMHINGLLSNDGNIQPKKAYEDFIKNHKNLQDKEYERIRDLELEDTLSEDELALKVKKTYKNKFYTLTH